MKWLFVRGLARLRGAIGCLITLSACASPSPTPIDILATETKLYSQHDEELLIRHFFNDERGGLFVDVGCWDWREGSTTLYLEERLGWSGLAVDAQPQLREGYERHRPRTRFFNFIVSDRSGESGAFTLPTKSRPFTLTTPSDLACSGIRTNRSRCLRSL